MRYLLLNCCNCYLYYTSFFSFRYFLSSLMSSIRCILFLPIPFRCPIFPMATYIRHFCSESDPVGFPIDFTVLFLASSLKNLLVCYVRPSGLLNSPLLSHLKTLLFAFYPIYAERYFRRNISTISFSAPCSNRSSGDSISS